MKTKSLGDKIFILALLFGVAWLVMVATSNYFNIDKTLIGSVEKITLMLVGALVTAHATEHKEAKKRGKKK